MRTLVTLPLAVLAATLVARPATAQEHAHDDLAHGPDPGARHLGHSHDGFPEFVDVFFTHHAYLERKLHPRFGTTIADEANEYEESAELVWRFTRWLGAELELPVVQVDPDLGDGAGGIGDIEVGPLVAFVQDPARLLILSARSGFGLPTGDEEEDLGAPGWTWEPALLVWKGYGAEKRGAIQAEVGYERLYADEGADEEAMVYNLAWSHWLASNWIPIAELNVVDPLGDAHAEDDDHADEHGGLVLATGGGVEAEDTLASATFGFRYAFANGQQWGGAVQLPLHDTDAYDWRLVIGGIVHLR